MKIIYVGCNLQVFDSNFIELQKYILIFRRQAVLKRLQEEVWDIRFRERNVVALVTSENKLMEYFGFVSSFFLAWDFRYCDAKQLNRQNDFNRFMWIFNPVLTLNKSKWFKRISPRVKH
jgi:hypothetical protein